MNYKDLFPIFQEFPKLHYLDSAATSLKPEKVIEDIAYFLRTSGGSPHRGAHDLSMRATRIYDQAREKSLGFLHAPKDMEAVFTAGATESVNLVASSITPEMAKGKDNIVITVTSHHSNLLPWQRLAKKYSLELKYIYHTQHTHLERQLLKINEKTLIVAFPQVVNATGFVHPAEKIIGRAREVGALTLVDGAQAVGHKIVDLRAMDPDFYLFSVHKVFGPTGVGVLFGKKKLLQEMDPYNLGGDMIEYVTEQEVTFAPVPQKFEAGTQNTMGAAGLLSALEFVEEIGLETIIQQENKVYQYAYDRLSEDPCVHIISRREKEGNIIAFNVGWVHPHDVASILNESQVAIRAGHHCTQPLMAHMNISASCRLSLGVYNVEEDIDALIKGIAQVKEIFGC